MARETSILREEIRCILMESLHCRQEDEEYLTPYPSQFVTGERERESRETFAGSLELPEELGEPVRERLPQRCRRFATARRRDLQLFPVLKEVT